jgi:hypothetical protein
MAGGLWSAELKSITESEFGVGARIRVHGLQAAPEHNGADGVIVEQQNNGRWGVELANGRALRLK